MRCAAHEAKERKMLKSGFAVVLGLVLTMNVFADGADAVKMRQGFFAALGGHTTAVGALAAGKVVAPEQIQMHAGRHCGTHRGPRARCEGHVSGRIHYVEVECSA